MTLQSSLLARLEPWRAAPAWQVAFSGGLDSTVLLHLLVQLSRQASLPPISAIHIHHGLQTEADAWVQHCQSVCDALNVALSIVRVQVQPGASLERAAREARYTAFETALGTGELLLQAQHQDDQAETVLYRLLRGAGVRGLAGIPEHRQLGRGLLLRPLLGIARSQLLAYAEGQGLSWVEDPSNADTRLARNFLRREIVPRLQGQWPQASAVLARGAAHQAEAQQLLDELAELDLQRCATHLALDWLTLPCLDLARVKLLSEARQRNLLRHWLAPFTRLPNTRHWQGWLDLRDAGADAAPVWRLEGGGLQRHGGSLLWLGGYWQQPWDARPQPWLKPDQPLQLPGNGQVWFEGAVPAGKLSVAYRQGGEVLEVPGRGRRDLKRLLQEAGLPGFMRGRLPLLYRDGQLVAVANLPSLSGCGSLKWSPCVGNEVAAASSLGAG